MVNRAAMDAPSEAPTSTGGAGAALRSGAVTVTGPRELRQAFPTWNAGPERLGRLRAEHGLPVARSR
jgi:hypothetical protein